MKENFEFYVKEKFIDIAYRKAQETLAKDAIDIDSFSDKYDPALIAKHQAYLKKREEEFSARGQYERPTYKLSVILEAIIHEHGEQSNWFGPYCRTIKTTSYDDIAHGVDEIVEFSEPERETSHLALGIDATYGTDRLGEKIAQILDKIDSDQLSQIDYFVSGDESYRGELNKIPIIVLCATEGTVKNLADIWVNDGRSLATNPFQLQILEEAAIQLDFFAKYAEKQGKTTSTRKYRSALSIIKKILDDKRKEVRDPSKARDGAYHELISRIKALAEQMGLEIEP